ncbi:MAG: hypothetical protein CVV13_08210 [Gammaproteobacteria bacterium HGW-Gammaproteobacteria-3]|jgi:PqqD family protein of HPr-rel-A system|nr:MAG: hypothetical protein CVV13_08210 [Gammaproteobacteria bacterium HGW-Gammaproteobacteria-3]
MSPECFRWSWLQYLEIEQTEWDDGIVIFNRLTQDTHFLNRPVDWILSTLRSGAMSFGDLHAQAVRDTVISNDNDSREALHQFLLCLKTLDFLESSVIDYADTALA